MKKIPKERKGEMLNTTPGQTWEERFEEKFLITGSVDSRHQFKKEVRGKLPRLLKQFIRQELNKQVKKIVLE